MTTTTARTDDTLTCTHPSGLQHPAELDPTGSPVPGSCARADEDAADALADTVRGLDLGDVLALAQDASHLLATVIDYGLPDLVRSAPTPADRVHLTGASDRLARAWGDVTLAVTALRAVRLSADAADPGTAP